ncbi:MAG TPA: isochorismatase family cysteine hydrolase [Ferrovibrio sp.]|jgi:ureidoacrylate peracid hydrolase|uniref:cysteine hydrolase family protein n=1 Tax=Ferrovibrio sp. TaxID=1917215 RepID=UPI002B4B0C40|nr:isochorismatase family cysteine hydrolase [Ferrovibrio sp.]HLT76178.1 isochorismatase family cysteine hydrolase [Ferrovibrio sp.]
MSPSKLDIKRTALVIVDLQNDFLHANGAYARGGANLPGAAELITNMKSVTDVMREAGGWIVSTQFTLVPGRGGEPLISPHLRQLRPFLRKGDFQPGAWGHSLIDELAPADFVVEKVAYSAFYMSRLEFVLRKAGIDTLLIGGIVTNGGVASTLRDAHVRDFHAFLLTDGSAAFSKQAHEACIASLGTVAPTLTCAEAVSLVRAA